MKDFIWYVNYFDINEGGSLEYPKNISKRLIFSNFPFLNLYFCVQNP